MMNDAARVGSSPSLSLSPLTGGASTSRRANAYERRMPDLMAWSPSAKQPSEPGFYATRKKIDASAVASRILFTGNLWMTGEPVAAWRPIAEGSPLEKPFRPVSTLHSELIERKIAGLNAPAKAKVFEDLALEPLDGDIGAEIDSMKELARLELKVQVINFLKPVVGAQGVSSGRVLAVSENYSAQDIGNASVVIHQNTALGREVKPGELVTMSYDGQGTARVFEGLAHEIQIDAPWLSSEQSMWLRMAMFDALQMIAEPMADDEKLKEAMRMGIHSTVNAFPELAPKFGRHSDAVQIELTINELAGPSFGTLTEGNGVNAEAALDPIKTRSRRP